MAFYRELILTLFTKIASALANDDPQNGHTVISRRPETISLDAIYPRTVIVMIFLSG